MRARLQATGDIIAPAHQSYLRNRIQIGHAADYTLGRIRCALPLSCLSSFYLLTRLAERWSFVQVATYTHHRRRTHRQWDAGHMDVKSFIRPSAEDIARSEQPNECGRIAGFCPIIVGCDASPLLCFKTISLYKLLSHLINLYRAPITPVIEWECV